MVLKAVRRMAAVFEIKRALNGRPAGKRLAARREHSVPVVISLEAWMRAERPKLSRSAEVAKAMNYMLV